MNRFKDAFFSALDGGVLVEFIGFIVRGAAEFEGFLPVADVVVLIVIRSSTTPESIFIYTF